MIYFLSWLFNTAMPLLITFLSCLAILYLANRLRILLYSSAMDVLAIREKYNSQTEERQKLVKLLTDVEQQHKQLTGLSKAIEQRKDKLLLDIGVIEQNQTAIEIGDNRAGVNFNG
jgi:hypothetical protein